MSSFKIHQIEQEADCNPMQSEARSTEAWNTDESFVSNSPEATRVEAINIKMPGKRYRLRHFTLTSIEFVAKKGRDLRAQIHGAELDGEDVCNVENGDRK